MCADGAPCGDGGRDGSLNVDLAASSCAHSQCEMSAIADEATPKDSSPGLKKQDVWKRSVPCRRPAQYREKDGSFAQLSEKLSEDLVGNAVTLVSVG